jgi:DNA-directed RNA polymerase specialized sigma24 family protein
MTLAAPCSTGTPSNTLAAPPAAALDWPELHRRHDRGVRLAVYHRLRQIGARSDPDRIDDLAQEVWCRLLQRDHARRPGPRGEHELETAEYLRKVAATVVVDVWRDERAGKRQPAQLDSLDRIPGRGVLSCADERACPLRRAEARDLLLDFLRHCRRLLGRKPARERLRVVRLVWIEGMTSVEAARALGGDWTPGAVDCLLMRLRRRLAADGIASPVRVREARG